MKASTAFFLEAAFLGVLLFGRKLVPPWAHFLAALMVALGTLFSSFWILAANSWMQTPAGYEIIDGRFFPKDWLAVIFSPSFPYRLAHTVVGFYVTTGFVVVGVAAYLLRKRTIRGRSPRHAVDDALAADGAGAAADLPRRPAWPQHARASAGQARRHRGALGDRTHAFRSPCSPSLTPADETNRFAIDVPLLGSLILTHSLDGEVKGLKDFRREDRPPVAIPFFAFRIMVGIGLLMLALVVASWWLR